MIHISSLFFKIPLMLMVFVYLIEMQIPSKIYLLLVITNAFITINEMFSYSNRPYSLHKIVNFFLLFFFTMANAVQYSTNTIVSSLHIYFTTEEYVKFQIINFFIIVFF